MNEVSLAITSVLVKESKMMNLAEAFWSDDFWLPPNVTWADIAANSTSHITFARFEDLYYPPAFAVVMLLLKFVVEKRLLRMLGIRLGLSEKRCQAPEPIPVLEAAFKPKKALDEALTQRLSRLAGMSPRMIERWWRQRTLASKANKLDKFCESGWRGLFYSTMYISSWFILWDKTWFWHITDCWHRYPYHSLPSDVWYFYMIELSFYWSLLISQFFDVRRADFREMFIHHLATICLMCLSWTCNLFRVGTLVLWSMDSADMFLEPAKMMKYLGMAKGSDFLFYCFVTCWMIMRLGYYPTWIIFSVTAEAPQFIQYFPAYHVFSLLLSTILILNLFWFYFIAKVGYLALLGGKIGQDARSESDDED